MLRSVKSFHGNTVCGTDGDLGELYEFFIDDAGWQIRYLEVDSRHWFGTRRVLISPQAVGHPEWGNAALPVAVSRKQLEESPAIDAGQPLTPIHLVDLDTFFGWPLAATGLMSDAGAEAAVAAAERVNPAPPAASDATAGLRGSREFLHYHVEATDGDIGRMDDLIVEDDTWQIRYLVVNAQHWLLNRKVLVAPTWVERVSWPERKVVARLTRDEIRDSPHYDPATPVNRDYEGRLFDYYGRSKYWEITAAKPEFPCPDCGHKFFAKLELENHRKECGPGKKSAHNSAGTKSNKSVIHKIEQFRELGSVGYRETGR